jgi:hypothetical protein
MYINIFEGFTLYFFLFLIQPLLAPLASPLKSPLSSLVVPLLSAHLHHCYSVSFSTLSLAFFLYILKNNSLKRQYPSDLKGTLFFLLFFVFVFFIVLLAFSIHFPFLWDVLFLWDPYMFSFLSTKTGLFMWNEVTGLGLLFLTLSLTYFTLLTYRVHLCSYLLLISQIALRFVRFWFMWI